jgi:hypothetical protein
MLSLGLGTKLGIKKSSRRSGLLNADMPLPSLDAQAQEFGSIFEQSCVLKSPHTFLAIVTREVCERMGGSYSKIRTPIKTRCESRQSIIRTDEARIMLRPLIEFER